MVAYAIPLAALIVSLTTLLLGYVSLRRYATTDYVSVIEKRLAAAEQELKECLAARVDLERRYHILEQKLERRDRSS